MNGAEIEIKHNLTFLFCLQRQCFQQLENENHTFLFALNKKENFLKSNYFQVNVRFTRNDIIKDLCSSFLREYVGQWKQNPKIKLDLFRFVKQIQQFSSIESSLSTFAYYCCYETNEMFSKRGKGDFALEYKAQFRQKTQYFNAIENNSITRIR